MKFNEIPFIRDHIALYKTDPEKAHMWDSEPGGGPGLVPTLLLTTRGCKSGAARDAALIYGAAGDGYAIIASRGGTPTHPSWFLNLEANPECDVVVADKAFRARARVAEAEERERIWREMAELYPPYDEYQARAGTRVIPVVVLDPIA